MVLGGRGEGLIGFITLGSWIQASGEGGPLRGCVGFVGL